MDKNVFNDVFNDVFNKVYNNVLYIGMAYDILAVFIINPDFENLYAIDFCDSAYSCGKSEITTFEAQKEEIKRILLDGHTGNTYDYKILQKSRKPYYLEGGPVEILSESDVKSTWTLKFTYDGKERNLIYYHHKDAFTVWNQEINNIGHIIIKGSLMWDNFLTPKMEEPIFNAEIKWIDYVKHNYEETFMKMIEERTTRKFVLYASGFNHGHYPYNIDLEYEFKDCESVRFVEIDKLEDGWRNKLIPEEISLCNRDSFYILLYNLIENGKITDVVKDKQYYENGNFIQKYYMFDILQKYDKCTDGEKMEMINLHKIS